MNVIFLNIRWLLSGGRSFMQTFLSPSALSRWLFAWLSGDGAALDDSVE